MAKPKQDLAAQSTEKQQQQQQQATDETTEPATVGTEGQLPLEDSCQRAASPVLSTGFSDADTVRHSHSSQHSDFTTLSPQSWPGSMKRFMVRSSSSLQSRMKLSKQPPARPALKIAVPNLVQSSHSPQQSIVPAEPEARELAKSSTTSSPVDPSYDPSTQSFRTEQDERNLPFIPVSKPNELSSFLDLDSSSDEETPTVQQASSGQVAKPQIVRNVSHAQTSKEIKLEEIDRSFTAEEEIVPATVSIAGNRAETLAKLEGIKLKTAKEEPYQHNALLPLPASPPVTKEDDDRFSFSKTPIDYIAAEGDPRMKRDGLRLNPVSHLDKAILHYTIHSPPLPKHNRNQVTMHPSNSQVETCLVDRSSAGRDATSSRGTTKKSILRSSINISTHTIPPSALHLTLALDRHPSATRDITIVIPGSSSSLSPSFSPSSPFDDRALFTAIRSSYHKHLVSYPCYILTPRTLTHATIGSFGKCLDGSDFAAHLLNPSLGRNRKDWLIWLRRQQQQQQQQRQRQQQNPPPTIVSSDPPGSHSRRRRAHGRIHGHPVITLHYGFNLQSIALAVLAVILLAAATTVAWVLFGFPGLHAGATTATTATTATAAAAAPVTLDLTPSPSPSPNSSSSSTTSPQLVPAHGIGSSTTSTSSSSNSGGQEALSSSLPSPSPSWQLDAQKRVLPALVLGFCVLTGGVVAIALWIWAGWLLL